MLPSPLYRRRNRGLKRLNQLPQDGEGRADIGMNVHLTCVLSAALHFLLGAFEAGSREVAFAGKSVRPNSRQLWVVGIDNYNVHCGGCLRWGSSPGAPPGCGVRREAACWKVGRWGLCGPAVSAQAAEKATLGQAERRVRGWQGLGDNSR